MSVYRRFTPADRLRARRHRRRRRLLRLFLVVAIVITASSIGMWWAKQASDKDSSVAAATPLPTESTPTPTARAAVPTPTPLPGANKLATDLQNIISNNPDIIIGISVANLKTGQIYESGADKTFTAASLTKLITATLFLKDVEAGTYSLDTPLGPYPAGWQLQQMVNQSNNDSWAFFNNLLGYPAQEAFAQQMGLTSYTSSQNSLSPHDLTVLLSNLYNGKLLNPEHTKLLLSYMQNTNEESYLPPAIPNSLTFYHKDGILEDNVHEGAIVETGNGPLAISIFTNGKGFYNYDERATLIQRLTRTILADKF